MCVTLPQPVLHNEFGLLVVTTVTEGGVDTDKPSFSTVIIFLVLT